MIIGFFNAVDTVCVACAKARHESILVGSASSEAHDYTQDTPLYTEDAQKDEQGYRCALCGKEFPGVQESTRIHVGYIHAKYYVYHLHCLPSNCETVQPVYLDQLGTRTALCHVCGNGLLYDYTSALQACRSCLVKYLDHATPYTMPDIRYRDAMHAFLLTLLTRAYQETTDLFYSWLIQEKAKNEEIIRACYAQDAEDEAMVCDAISKDVVFDALLRLYDLPYTSTHA